MKGKGIETKKTHGDLIVTVDVQVPTELTGEQRTAVEALAAAIPAVVRLSRAAARHRAETACSEEAMVAGYERFFESVSP